MTTSRKSHWEQVYASKSPQAVSWFQIEPTLSLRLIKQFTLSSDTAVIDVGGGASCLVDALLADGYQQLTVLDIAAAAMVHAQQRLADQADRVTWLEADITRFDPPQRYSLWHDRAVFHFLTDAVDRRAYVQALTRALHPEGVVIIAAFAPGGPAQCSNLDVRHYNADLIRAELGDAFALVTEEQELHQTPSGHQQPFNYFVFRRVTPYS